MNNHWLYRCYDVDDRLVYVGCARNPKRRISNHRNGHGRPASKLLSVFMVRYTTEGPFPDRETARAAEAQAILSQQPVFNHQERGLPTFITHNSIAGYLVDHGRRDLAIEHFCGCWPEAREVGMRDSFCAAHEGTDVPVFAFPDEQAAS